MFSAQSIEALAQAISGGSANDPSPSIGHYRQGWKIQRFLAEENVSFDVGGSRLGSLINRLLALRDERNGPAALQRLAEKVADPRDFIAAPAAGTAVLEYLNRHLAYDDLGLVIENRRARLRSTARTAPVVDAFTNKTVALNFETVQIEVARALESADRDPPIAITAACVIIESVCRSILAELKTEPPAKRDVEGLLRAVQEPLGLSPARTDVPDLIAADVRQVLGGLTSVAKGIGALRTHGGSAHAPVLGQAPVDARMARFAIHSASTIALFLVETWERKQRQAGKVEPRSTGRVDATDRVADVAVRQAATA